MFVRKNITITSLELLDAVKHGRDCTTTDVLVELKLRLILELQKRSSFHVDSKITTRRELPT